jgi:hypothetical protein
MEQLLTVVMIGWSGFGNPMITESRRGIMLLTPLAQAYKSSPSSYGGFQLRNVLFHS